MKRSPKLKGAQVPHVLLYVYGVLDRKLFHCANAGSDPLTTGYVITKKHAFQEYCRRLVEFLEYDLKAIRCEAADLIAEDAVLRKELAKDLPKMTASASVADIRRMRALVPRRQAAIDRRMAIARRLAQIGSQIHSRELLCQQEIEIAKAKIHGCVAAYARGVKRKALSEHQLPQFDASSCFDVYKRSHADEDARLAKMIQKEET